MQSGSDPAAATFPLRRARRRLRLRRLALSLLATSALTSIFFIPVASAQTCTDDAPPADAASPAQLYDRLRRSMDAALLTMDFDQRVVADACAWVYQVRVLTTAGAVVELDFAAADLAVVGARGPQHDQGAADLLRSLKADTGLLRDSGKGQGAGPNKPGSDDSADEGGESGSSNSGSGSSDDGSDDSSEGGSGSGGSGSGGSGGSSGSGSGGSGSSGSGSGGGEGGEGGGGEGGEGGGND